MVNFIFALWIAFMPLIQSLSAVIGFTNYLIGVDLSITLQISLFGVIYGVYLLVKLSISDNKKQLLVLAKNKFKKPITYLVLGLILSMFISSCINGLTLYSFVYIAYFVIFYCIYSLDKDQIKMFVNLVLAMIAISCVMGFIDPTNSFMPGFYEECYNISIHFWNPNYAGYIVATCTIIVVMKLKDANKLKEYIFYSLIFCIYALYLFMNGSFVPITAVFLLVFLLLIFYWIKDKKFPLKLAILFVALVPFAFIVDAFPNVNDYRTTNVNYFTECIAVIDNYLGTNLLSNTNVDVVLGADGWDRSELIHNAVTALKPSETNNILPLLFGYGASYFSNIRPHNNYMCISLDYGIFATIFYILILVYFFIKFIKTKKKNSIVTFVAAVLIMIVMSFFGSIIDFWYWIFVCVLAIGFKLMNEEAGTKNNLKTSNVEKNLNNKEEIQTEIN